MATLLLHAPDGSPALLTLGEHDVVLIAVADIAPDELALRDGQGNGPRRGR